MYVAVPAIEAVARDRLATAREALLRRGLPLTALPERPALSPEAILEDGLPPGTITEFLGPPAGGKASLAARLLAAVTQNGLLAAWVDPARQLFPPALDQHGVQLGRLLHVTPPLEVADVLWATEVLVESGLFAVVVLDVPADLLVPASGRERALLGRRLHILRRAAERNGGSVLVLAERPVEELRPALRLTATNNISSAKVPVMMFSNDNQPKRAE
jgi:hypothetical protein